MANRGDLSVYNGRTALQTDKFTMYSTSGTELVSIEPTLTTFNTPVVFSSNSMFAYFNVTSNYNDTTFYGDGIHDDAPAIRAAIDVAVDASVVTEFTKAHVIVPAGYIVRLN